MKRKTGSLGIFCLTVACFACGQIGTARASGVNGTSETSYESPGSPVRVVLSQQTGRPLKLRLLDARIPRGQPGYVVREFETDRFSVLTANAPGSRNSQATKVYVLRNEVLIVHPSGSVAILPLPSTWPTSVQVGVRETGGASHTFIILSAGAHGRPWGAMQLLTTSDRPGIALLKGEIGPGGTIANQGVHATALMRALVEGHANLPITTALTETLEFQVFNPTRPYDGFTRSSEMVVRLNSPVEPRRPTAPQIPFTDDLELDVRDVFEWPSQPGGRSDLFIAVLGTGEIAIVEDVGAYRARAWIERFNGRFLLPVQRLVVQGDRVRIWRNGATEPTEYSLGALLAGALRSESSTQPRQCSEFFSRAVARP